MLIGVSLTPRSLGASLVFMGARSSYVFLSSALLVAALAAGVATWLEWLPCEGSMLNGSILLGFQYPSEFSDACLARMDGSAAVPLSAGAVEARAFSALLLGLGWLGFAARLPLPTILRAVVLLPVVPIGWFAIETWLSRDAGSIWETTAAMSAIEATAIAAAVVIILRLGTARARLTGLIGLWAVTSYGLLHYLGDYLAMVAFSDANWDVPPGFGYLTAVVIAGGGLLVAALGRHTDHAGDGLASLRPPESGHPTARSLRALA